MVNVKEHVAAGKKVHFDYCRSGVLYYRTESGLLFEVPLEDAGTAVFNRDEKSIYFMRWIRKQLEANEEGKKEMAL